MRFILYSLNLNFIKRSYPIFILELMEFAILIKKAGVGILQI